MVDDVWWWVALATSGVLGWQLECCGPCHLVCLCWQMADDVLWWDAVGVKVGGGEQIGACALGPLCVFGKMVFFWVRLGGVTHRIIIMTAGVPHCTNHASSQNLHAYTPFSAS